MCYKFSCMNKTTYEISSFNIKLDWVRVFDIDCNSEAYKSCSCNHVQRCMMIHWHVFVVLDTHIYDVPHVLRICKHNLFKYYYDRNISVSPAIGRSYVLEDVLQ